MKKLPFLLVLWLYGQCCLAQRGDSCFVLNSQSYSPLENIAVLPDKNYSFEQVSQDSTLPFRKETHLLAADKSDYYWVRCTVQNTSKYSKKCCISVFPFLDNTLYYYNDDAQKWLTVNNGLAIGNTAMRNAGLLPCLFQANKKSTFYVKIGVQRLRKEQFGAAIKISLSLFDAATSEQVDARHYWYWFITMAIIAVFFCYNTYIYILYKDATHFYYLIILLGAMIYITALHKILNILSSLRIYNIEAHGNGNLYNYDLNGVLGGIGAILVVLGFVELTRSYFRLEKTQPRLDVILKYANPIFAVWRLMNIFLTISGVYYATNKTYQVENGVSIILFFLLLYGSIVAYRKGFKPATYFLIAHAIPLVLIILVATMVSLYYENQLGVFILPDIAAVIQSFTCAIALVARVDFVQSELAEERVLAQRLQRENEKISLQNQVIAAQNERVNSENEKIALQNQVITAQNERISAEYALAQANQKVLEEKLAFNQRELASVTMYLYQKNEILLDLQKQIGRLPQIAAHSVAIKLINNAIKSNIYLEADWENFKRHFEQVHPDFFKKLQAEHPSLTTNEIRLCAYFHINLSVKEIAAMLNIDPASVRKARTRLNKKMNIESKEDEAIGDEDPVL